MKIALGTTSIEKKTIVKKCFDSLKISSEIVSIGVDSMITNQPLDEKTTIIGAKNRAKNAFQKENKSDIGLGLEGGLDKIESIYYLVCAVAIYDAKGNYYLGLSSKLALPKQVSSEVSSGHQFGDSIRNFQKKNYNNKELGKLIDKLLNRESAFQEAISNAIIQYKNNKFY